VLAFLVWVGDDVGVEQPRFRRVDRDQRYLLPPDVREWLPVGHPALFVVELVESLDLSGFVSGYRSSRERGRPAFHPRVMVGIALYASMTSVLSSRRIERLLATDAGFRVVAANEQPDHVTICRFLVRHRGALEELFAQVVGLAADAGLVDPTLVALDGTKMAADASKSRNEKLVDLRARYGQWADVVAANDAADDAAQRDGAGGGPIPEMANRESMREWIRRRLAQRADEDGDRRMNVTDPDSGLLPRSGGGWVQGYNAQAAAVLGGIVVAADVTSNPVDTTMLEPMVARIDTAIRQATAEPAGVVVADAGYWHSDTIEAINADPERLDLLVATGRRQPDAVPDPLPEPDRRGYETAIVEHDEMLEAERARRVEIVGRVVAGELLLREAADILQISDKRVSNLKVAWQSGAGPDAVPLPRRNGRWQGPPRPRPPVTPTQATRSRHAMDTRLASSAGRSFYRQRQAIIEAVFGDLKTNRRTTRFLRRGIDKVRAEWHWMLLGHNLTILHRHTR
jgi:transposase